MLKNIKQATSAVSSQRNRQIFGGGDRSQVTIITEMGQLKGSWEVKEGREMTGTGEMGFFFFFFLSTQYARYRVRCRGSNVNEVPLP